MKYLATLYQKRVVQLTCASARIDKTGESTMVLKLDVGPSLDNGHSSSVLQRILVPTYMHTNDFQLLLICMQGAHALNKSYKS
jgi:hypothetical protein